MLLQHSAPLALAIKETLMRRDTFLKSLAALAAASALHRRAVAAGANLKMLIPANPGGGCIRGGAGMIRWRWI